MTAQVGNFQEMGHVGSGFERRPDLEGGGVEPYIAFGEPSNPFECMILPDKKDFANRHSQAPKVSDNDMSSKK